MENLIYLIKFVFCSAVIFAVMVSLYFLGQWYGIRRHRRDIDERFYNIVYKDIQDKIRKLEVNEQNCQLIWDHINQLEGFSYKNKEKTRGLKTEFVLSRFRPIVEEGWIKKLKKPVLKKV